MRCRGRDRRGGDEWTEGRRYMGQELLAKSRIRIVTTEPEPASTESVQTTEALTA